jgi:hypothetical protein
VRAVTVAERLVDVVMVHVVMVLHVLYVVMVLHVLHVVIATCCMVLHVLLDARCWMLDDGATCTWVLGSRFHLAHDLAVLLHPVTLASVLLPHVHIFPLDCLARQQLLPPQPHAQTQAHTHTGRQAGRRAARTLAWSSFFMRRISESSSSLRARSLRFSAKSARI